MTSGVWLYPGDLTDQPGLAELVRESVVDTVCVAAAYHSLLACRPGRSAAAMVQFPATAIYFTPDDRLWRDQVLWPTVSPTIAGGHDVLAAGGTFARAAGTSLTAWLVCLHDDDLVRTRPDLAVRAATGDVLLGAPCLRAPEVRGYAVTLVRDAAARADAVQLESLHWLPQPHARHSKIDGAAPRLSRLLTSVCFCPRCAAAAHHRGLDAGAVADQMVQRWAAAWDGLAADDPDAVPGLARYLQIRAEAVTTLIAEVVQQASVPVEVLAFGDPQLTGLSPAAAEAGGASVRISAYGTAGRVSSLLDDARRAADRAAALHVGLSILPEHAPDLADAVQAARSAAAAGAHSIRLYHLGLASDRRRRWLPSVIQAWSEATRGGASR